MVNKDLGMVTAYAYAVSKGYTGTEEEFAALMADYADVGERAEAAEQDAQAAKTAAEGSATAAAASATQAQESTTRAAQKASEASASATAAATSATNAEAAKTDAETAQTASEAAKDTAVANATTATTKAAEAAQSASSASDSETAAEAAATRAEQAAASLTVDSALSETSKNPVQNKVVTGAVTDLKSTIKNADDNIARIADTQLRYEYYDFTLGNIQTGTHAGATDRCYTEVLPLDKDIKVYFDDSQYRCLFVYLEDDETTATIAGFAGTSPCTVNAGVSITTYPKFRIEIATKTAPTIDIEDVALSTYQVQDTNIASRQYVYDLVTGATSSVTVGQTGDYADLRACFAAITPSKLNHYNVYIQAGEYDIRSLFSATERAQSGFRGLFVPDYITLIGLGGKDATKLVWDGTNDTASSSIATLNFSNVVSLQGLTVIGKNIRYTIHDDFANDDTENVRNIKDCDFIGESLVLNAIYGSGSGQYGNANWHFENCIFKGANLICFMQHNVANVTKASYITFRNCRFYGARGNEMQLASYNSGVTALNYIILQGCKFSTASGTLGEIYMNESQGQGIKFKIIGFSNQLDKVTIENTDGVDYSSYIDLI